MLNLFSDEGKKAEEVFLVTELQKSTASNHVLDAGMSPEHPSNTAACVESSAQLTKDTASRLHFDVEENSLANWTVLGGNYSQGHYLILGDDAGVQCTAIAGYALAKVHVQELETWTPETVDDCLKEGTKFYRLNKNTRDKKEPMLRNEPFLEATELIEPVLIGDRKFKLNFAFPDQDSSGLLLDENGSYVKLRNTMLRVMKSSLKGILTCNKMSIAVVGREKTTITLVDSHPLDQNGFSKETNGVASVLTFHDVDQLISVLSINLKAEHYQKLRKTLAESNNEVERGEAFKYNWFQFYDCTVEDLGT